MWGSSASNGYGKGGTVNATGLSSILRWDFDSDLVRSRYARCRRASSEQAGTDNPTAHEKLAAIHRGSPQLRWASRLAREIIAPAHQLAQPLTSKGLVGPGRPCRELELSGATTANAHLFDAR